MMRTYLAQHDSIDRGQGHWQIRRGVRKPRKPCTIFSHVRVTLIWALKEQKKIPTLSRSDDVPSLDAVAINDCGASNTRIIVSSEPLTKLSREVKAIE
jgi:hypothetical protein